VWGIRVAREKAWGKEHSSILPKFREVRRSSGAFSRRMERRRERGEAEVLSKKFKGTPIRSPRKRSKKRGKDARLCNSTRSPAEGWRAKARVNNPSEGR